MTDRKHLKARVRARMAHTGERYAAARVHVVGADAAAATPPAAPGINPTTAALVALLERAGLAIPEPLALVVGGGVGIGVFQFHYAKENVSTFFVAGRHRWEDDAAYLVGALHRLGLDPIVDETGSARVAERQLRTALADSGPVVAWVDAAELGTRGLPDAYRGGAYHVLVIRAIDDERGVATVDDLADAPLQVPLDTLARARGRIAKDRNRLLRLAPGTATSSAHVRSAVRSGLVATVDGLQTPRSRAFSLDALSDWATRLRADSRDGWATVFPAGDRLWGALAAIHQNVEHYGSGGGLGRPMFADGLRLAAVTLVNPSLDAVARHYDDLGRAWSDLATAALPAGIPAFRRTRQLQDRRAARYRASGPETHEDLLASWQETAALRGEVADCWPLDDASTAALKLDLADRIEAIAVGEQAALAALAELVDRDGPAG